MQATTCDAKYGWFSQGDFTRLADLIHDKFNLLAEPLLGSRAFGRAGGRSSLRGKGGSGGRGSGDNREGLAPRRIVGLVFEEIFRSLGIIFLPGNS